MKRSIEYHNDHVLSFTDYGDLHGFPILVQHGMIASITDYHLFDRLIAVGRRVICMARPGYGASSPYRMKNLAEWGDIAAFLVAELKLTQFNVLGMSAGAPYSYAIGYKLANQVRNIFIFSGIPALYDDRVIEFWPYEVNRNANLAELEKVAKDVFFSGLTAEDLLHEDIKDSMMNDCFGVAQDLELRSKDWGFALSVVKARVQMEHSMADRNVPFATAELTAKMLPNCQFTTREGEHFSERLLDDFIRNVMLSSAA